MQEAASPQRLSPSWKLAILLPVLAGAVLLVMALRETDLHRKIALTTLGNLGTMLTLISMSIYWIVSRKAVGWGIVLLVLGSGIAGFGIHTLLRLF